MIPVTRSQRPCGRSDVVTRFILLLSADANAMQPVEGLVWKRIARGSQKTISKASPTSRNGAAITVPTAFAVAPKTLSC
jgi:hypothetical protein